MTGTGTPAFDDHASGDMAIASSSMVAIDSAGDVDSLIELTVPALASFLGVVRTATASLAARLSFAFDDIEDLRIAVDEACAMVLALPAPQDGQPATLTCRYQVHLESLAVTVSAPVAATAVLPAEQSFAWQVLSMHAADVNGAVTDGRARVDLRKVRR